MNIIIDNSTTIKKSNRLSAGRLMSSLSLNQAQLFAYAILKTQKDGLATFSKSEFEKQFNLVKYRTEYAIEDAKTLFNLNVMIINEEDWILEHVFKSLKYKKGTFTYQWEDEFKQYIIDLQERYTRIDLSIASKFRSSFSWTLYEFLLSKYGHYQLELSKEEMLEFFSVADKKTYIENTAMFKRAVLDTAIEEVNKFTELNVRYDEIKKGRSIIGFKLYFRKENIEISASEKQTKYIQDLLNKLKNDYLLKIIEIENLEQANKANNQIMNTLRSYKNINYNQLTHTEADTTIKNLNENIKLIEKIINDDMTIQTVEEQFKDVEIPILSLDRSKNN